MPRDLVPEILRPLLLLLRTCPPLQQFRTRGLRNGRAFKFLSPGIHQPHAWLLAKLRSEIQSVGCWFASDHVVRSLTERHLLRGTRPFLILQPRGFQADRVVKTPEKTVGILNKENRGALVRHQAMAIHNKLVALGFPSENRMIVENQTS